MTLSLSGDLRGRHCAIKILLMRAIPDNNLAYPIKIELATGGGGTGFFLNDDGTVYVVTAKHVLFEPKKGIALSEKFAIFAQPRDQGEDVYSEFSVDLKLILSETKNAKMSTTHDVVIIKFFDVKTAKFCEGITVDKQSKSGIIGVSLGSIKKFDEVLISNEVFVMGYPSSIGLKQTPQIDYNKPLLRNGIVAGKNKDRKIIILDAEVYPGNSGGPVIKVTRESLADISYSVIGLVSEFVPFAHKTVSRKDSILNNSGYSIVTPIDPVLELL